MGAFVTVQILGLFAVNLAIVFVQICKREYRAYERKWNLEREYAKLKELQERIRDAKGLKAPVDKDGKKITMSEK